MSIHWHFIGIGGAGMSVLAHALLDRGDRVSGSDAGDSAALAALRAREAGRDPAFLVGGVINDLGTGGHWGSGPELVAEADEYDGSFWELRPQIAVITNIEADHLDYYADLAAIHESFRRFADNLRPGG